MAGLALYLCVLAHLVFVVCDRLPLVERQARCGAQSAYFPDCLGCCSTDSDYISGAGCYNLLSIIGTRTLTLPAKCYTTAPAPVVATVTGAAVTPVTTPVVITPATTRGRCSAGSAYFEDCFGCCSTNADSVNGPGCYDLTQYIGGAAVTYPPLCYTTNPALTRPVVATSRAVAASSRQTIIDTTPDQTSVSTTPRQTAVDGTRQTTVAATSAATTVLGSVLPTPPLATGGAGKMLRTNVWQWIWAGVVLAV